MEDFRASLVVDDGIVPPKKTGEDPREDKESFPAVECWLPSVSPVDSEEECGGVSTALVLGRFVVPHSRGSAATQSSVSNSRAMWVNTSDTFSLLSRLNVLMPLDRTC